MLLENIESKRKKNKTDFKYMMNRDLLALNIADSDFNMPQHIIDNVISRVQEGNMTYQFYHKDLYQAVQNWYSKKYDVDFTKEQILLGQGVMFFIRMIIFALTKKQDNILIMSPVFTQFNANIKRLQREVIETHLVFKNNDWQINFEDLEKKLQQSKIMILCSPHNPLGKVWSKQDLEKIHSLTLKHNVILLVDEIWQDLHFENNFTHSLSLPDQTKIIHVSSPAKTFNMSNINKGHLISKDKQLFDSINLFYTQLIGFSMPQPWIQAAYIAAYDLEASQAWHSAYLQQIKNNMQALSEFFTKHNIDHFNPDSTFVIFAKIGNSKINGQKLDDELKKLKLKIDPGINYGDNYKKWIRISASISSQKLLSVIEKMKIFLSNRNK